MAQCGAGTVAFIQLKVACNVVMQAPTLDSIGHLKAMVHAVPVTAIQDLHGHILFVLLQQLQDKSIRSNVKIKICECMREVLSRCKRLKLEAVLIDNLMLCFLGVMYDPESDNLVTDNPEELHATCLRCICIMMCHSTVEDRSLFYSAKRAPMLGVLVCVCLKQAASQQYRELKVAALECLMACGQVLESAQPTHSELKVRTANIFSNFTPGIAAGLQQVICGHDKQGHAVTMVALRAWGRLLTQVLNEDVLELSTTATPAEVTTNTLSSATTSAQMEGLLMKSERSAAWVAHADARLAGNVVLVCGVRNHPHHKVRLELVNTAHLLLSNCSRAVPQCVPPLLDTLLSLAEDEDNEVSSAARSALEYMAAKCDSQQGKSLTEIIEEGFFNAASTLPAKFIHASSGEQRSRMAMLLGYLKLLGPRLPHTLLLCSHLEVLMSALLQISTLDCSSVLLLEDIALRDIGSDSLSRPWCRLRHASDAVVHTQLSEVCSVLADHADVALITEHLLRVFSEQSELRREATMLINLILARGATQGDHLGLVRRVLRTYLDPAVWELPLSMEEEDYSGQVQVTLASVRANVVQACLMTEGVASLTASTGSAIRQLLCDVLYPVLERAGSPLELVSMAGRRGLGVLAMALGHDSPGQLIEREADYFSHTLELRLRRPRDNPGALLVLSAILTHSSSNILPCIRHLVSGVLVQSCDKFQEKSLTSYLHVFHTFLLNLGRWLQQDPPTPPANEPNVTRLSGESLLIHELRAHHKWKLEAGEEEPMQEESDQHDETLDAKMVPEYVAMCEAVMLRCVYYLPSPDKSRQVLALSCLQLGVQILAPHEEQLLPMVHKIWSPLLLRFSPREDIVVLRQSFELLCTMAHVAKDFLRKRTLDKVLPVITSFLIKQAQETRKQRSESFSQSVKLQRVALLKLAQLAEDLDVQEETLADILQAAAPYLSAHQPPALQECCLDLFRHVCRVNADIVWLQLRMLWNPEPELRPPHPSCTLIRLPRDTLEALEYKTNVLLLEKHV